MSAILKVCGSMRHRPSGGQFDAVRPAVEHASAVLEPRQIVSHARARPPLASMSLCHNVIRHSDESTVI